MAFGSFDKDQDMPMAEINVTPLVDVMLVLLIVFMITMPVLTHSIPLQLPTSAEKSQQNAPTDPVRLSIDTDGAYYLGEQRVALADLEQFLASAKAKNADVVLAVAADKAVAYEKVVDALSAAQQAGIGKIGFVTEEKE